jgi:hypothetical protein
MREIDPFTSEEFTPKRHNQRFACRANQIAYNNMLARNKRELLRESHTKLNTNRSVLKKLFERGEKTVSRDFLLGAGFDFLYYTQNYNHEGRQFHAAYEYLIEVLDNQKFIISKK